MHSGKGVTLQVVAVMSALYIMEPALSTVYVHHICTAGEAVLAALRMEIFRIMLMQVRITA